MRGWWRLSGPVLLTGGWPVIGGKWSDYADTGTTDTGTGGDIDYRLCVHEDCGAR